MYYLYLQYTLSKHYVNFIFSRKLCVLSQGSSIHAPGLVPGIGSLCTRLQWATAIINKFQSFPFSLAIFKKTKNKRYFCQQNYYINENGNDCNDLYDAWEREMWQTLCCWHGSFRIIILYTFKKEINKRRHERLHSWNSPSLVILMYVSNERLLLWGGWESTVRKYNTPLAEGVFF